MTTTDLPPTIADAEGLASTDGTTRTADHEHPMTVALRWAERGFQVFPVAISWNEEKQGTDKRPLIHTGHLGASSDPELVRDWFADPPIALRDGEVLGVGMRPTGVVLDLDRHGEGDGVAYGHDVLGLPPTYTVDTASRGEHLHYETAVRYGNQTPPEWDGLVDVRAARGWVVAPGTVTPWGSWTERTPWEQTPLAALPASIAEVLTEVGAQVSQGGSWRRYVPADHDDALHPATVQAHADLVEHHGVDPKWTTYRTETGRDPWLEVTRPGKSGGISASVGYVGPGVLWVFSTGWEGMAHLTPLEVVGDQVYRPGERPLVEMAEPDTDAEDGGPEPWAEPEPFTDGSTVPYPVDALPDGMAAAVMEVAEAVIVDPAIPAMAFLGASAGAFGTATEVVITPTWRTKCNVYLVTVAETSVGKTPGSGPAWDPLREIERQIKEDAAKAKREAAVTLPIFKAELKALQKDNPTALVDMLVLQAQIGQAEETLRRDARLIVDDVTPERMGELMHDNGGRLVAVNDEGSLLRHLLGMYSSSPNLDPFLKGWDGNMLVVDRKGSGDKPGSELVVPDPRLTLIAAVQPVTIRQIGEPRHRHLIERGVLGRILPSWPQDTIGQRVFSGRVLKPYRKVDPWNAEVLRLGGAGEKVLPFTDAAREVFFVWHDEVERALPAGGLYADVRSFSKVRDSTARIAGILARHDGADQVEVDHVRRAIRIGDYHLAHALALVESWSGAPMEVARNLVTRLPRRLRDKPMPDGYTGGRFAQDGSMRFTVREATWISKAKVDAATDALHVLAEHGYVRAEDWRVGFGESAQTVGKRSAVVLLNPEAVGA